MATSLGFPITQVTPAQRRTLLAAALGWMLGTSMSGHLRPARRRIGREPVAATSVTAWANQAPQVTF